MPLSKLFKVLDLGDVTKDVVKVEGGLLHEVYLVETSSNKYAVKKLNKRYYDKSDFFTNTYTSNKFAKFVKDYNVPSLPAIDINNESIHELDSTYYMLYDWINGETALNKTNSKTRTKTMASQLGLIHRAGEDFSKTYDYKPVTISPAEYPNINFDRRLVQISKEVIDAYNKTVPDSIFSHRDMDKKNVLWIKDKPYIIDWEASGFINPFVDLINVAIYWSLDKNHTIDYDLLKDFIRAYKENGFNMPEKMDQYVLASLNNKINWQNYMPKDKKNLEFIFYLYDEKDSICKAINNCK